MTSLRGQNQCQIRSQWHKWPPGIDFGGCMCNLKFQGRQAAASMTLEAKTEARFELSGPDYPQVSILEAIGAIRIYKAARPRPQWPWGQTEAIFGLSMPSYITYWPQFPRLQLSGLSFDHTYTYMHILKLNCFSQSQKSSLFGLLLIVAFSDQFSVLLLHDIYTVPTY